MKKTFKTIALFSVLGLVAVSCQQEPMVELTTIASSPYEHCVVYAYDGMNHQLSFTSEEDWLLFLDQLFALAESGKPVTICNAESRVSTKQTRKIVTYTTENRKDAYTWASSMEAEGYRVSISYDKTTGIYTCTAIK